MNAIVLKGARLIDPASGMDAAGDISIADGRIAEVGKITSHPTGARAIELPGCWVMPGLCDAHVHFRQPGFEHKETIATGSAAAARGGYTSVVCEPNTKPPIDNIAVVEEVARIAARDSLVKLRVKVCMTEGQRGDKAIDPAPLARNPIVAAVSDDGNPIIRRDVAAEACRLAARCGLPVSPHCEDSERSLADCLAMPDCEFAGREPFTNEDRFIRRDIECAEAAGAALHISHVSLAASLEMIRRAKVNGLAVTCEAAPHHLLLDSSCRIGGAMPLVNPPLRPAGDVATLGRALEDGLIDAIATDHAPHAADEKKAGARGLIGLECSLALIITGFVKTGRITPMRMAELMSAAPRRIFRLEPAALRPGAPGDIVVIDPDAQWTIDSSAFASKSRNCPYDGRRVSGRAILTIVSGRIVWEA
ncbi:MAG TPA: dihydroorotase [Candidatus Brocadiia bacterium]|nr:dihydroorotase [Candidatus Brocadiia bacterium]